LIHAGGDVAGELLDEFNIAYFVGESFFNFDDRRTSGDVDPSERAVTDLLFQPWGVQVEISGGQQGLNVGLNIGFSTPRGIWGREASDQRLRCSHGLLGCVGKT